MRKVKKAKKGEDGSSVGGGGVVTDFDNIAEIKAITGANIGMRVYSKAHASNFIFKASSTSPVNDGTVLQGIGGVWEMEIKDNYYASWFATPNVQSDQAPKLQAGYAYARSVGKPFIVDDIFYAKDSTINTDLADFNYESAATVINLLSNSVISFTSKGEINLITSNKSHYNVILGFNVENVSITS